jgi:hypothetical protein
MRFLIENVLLRRSTASVVLTKIFQERAKQVDYGLAIVPNLMLIMYS